MKNNIMMCLLVILVLGSATTGLYARVYSERDLDDFVKEMRKSDTGLIMASLYFEDSKIDSKEVRDEIKDYRKDFDKVSDEEPKVRFISSNIAKKRADDIKQEYYDQLGLPAESREPVIILFKNGSPLPLKDNAKRTVVLKGIVTREQMRDFLYSNFLDDIKKVVKQDIKDRRERRRTRWYYGPGFYLGWDYPWGYGYPYWGYPYRRWGWGCC